MNYLQLLQAERDVRNKGKELRDFKRKKNQLSKRMKKKYGKKWTKAVASQNKKEPE